MQTALKHAAVSLLALTALLIPCPTRAYDNTGATLSVSITTSPFEPDPTLINMAGTSKPIGIVRDGDHIVKVAGTTWTWDVIGLEYVDANGKSHTLAIPNGKTTPTSITYSGTSPTGGTPATVTFTIQFTHRNTDTPDLISQFDQIGSLNITYNATAYLPPSKPGEDAPKPIKSPKVKQ